METIVFPDCIAVVCTYLTAQLAIAGDTDTTVGSRVGTAARQIVVTLVDSAIKQLVIQTSIVRIDCYADETLGEEAAHDLGQLSRGLLGALQGTKQGDVTVYKVADAPPGLRDDPDPLTGKARHTFHLAISLRGTAR